jgi:hypothetical protein
LIYLGFVTEGKLAAVLIKPSLGVSNWTVIYIINYTPTKQYQVFWHRSILRHQGAIYKLSRAVVKLASINLWKLVLSPTGSINLGLILREDLMFCSSYLPLGVPNWADIYMPSIYHKTKSSICCWYLIMISTVVYTFQKTMSEIDVGTERLLLLHLTLSIRG